MSEANGYATRDSFGARRYRDVELPSGAKVRIRSLSQRELAATASHVKADQEKDADEFNRQCELATIRSLMAAVVNGDGEPIFRDPDDTDLVRDMDVCDYRVLTEEVNRHVLPTRTVERLAKNSDAIDSASSPSS